MLDTIKNALPSLSRAERQVAETILKSPEASVDASIQSLAKMAGVSEPTIIRFCRRIGVSGYQTFKLKLAQSLVSENTFFFQDVSDDDDGAALSHKVVDSAIASLVQLKHQVDPARIDAAIDLLLKCERIEFYGSGGSGVVAEDAQLKFFRLGKPAIAYSDAHIQPASAALLDDRSVVVAISASGRNKDLLHSVGIASDAGAKIIAIAASGSPLAEIADIGITMAIEEDSDVFSPIKSRLAQMVVLDILVVGCAARGGTESLSRLRAARRAIDFKFR